MTENNSPLIPGAGPGVPGPAGWRRFVDDAPAAQPTPSCGGHGMLLTDYGSRPTVPALLSGLDGDAGFRAVGHVIDGVLCPGKTTVVLLSIGGR